jgi:hypothetical protein
MLLSRTQEGLRNGTLIVSGDQWPIFLYRDYKHNPVDIWEGLFRSHLLVSVSVSSGQVSRGESLDTDTGFQAYLHLSKLSRSRTSRYPIGECSHSRYEESYCSFVGLCGYPSTLFSGLCSNVRLTVTLGTVRPELFPHLFKDGFSNRL